MEIVKLILKDNTVSIAETRTIAEFHKLLEANKFIKNCKGELIATDFINKVEVMPKVIGYSRAGKLTYDR